MASSESPESTSERKTSASCFFCSFPITISSSKQNEEGSGCGGNKSLDLENRPPLHSNDNNDDSKMKSKKEVVFKYLLSDCKDKELNDSLTAPSFQLELCEICEGRAADILELHLQLKVIKEKLTDKIKEVTRIIIGNSGGTRSHQLLAGVRTFLREKEETQVNIPSTLHLHPVEVECCPEVECFQDETDKIEELKSSVKEEVEVDEADDYDDDEADMQMQGDITPPTISNLVKVRTSSASSSRKKKNKCNICQERFDGGSALLRHKIRVHDHPKLKCELCPPPGKSYMERKSLKQHHLRCHSNGEIKGAKVKKKGRLVIDSSEDECEDKLEQHCELCTKTFKNYSNLIVHCRREHPSAKLKCSLCPNAEEAALLSPLDELPRHLDESHGISDLRLTCDVSTCGKVFYLRNRLSNHREHHHKKSYRCKKCVEVFASNSELKAHNATAHLQTQRFSCNLCSERFSGKNALVCHKISAHNLSISEAKMRQNPEVPLRKKKSQQTKTEYTCEFCSKTFAYWDSRLNHLIVEHGHPKLKCELCPPFPGTFLNCHSTLSAHRKRHHPAEGEDNFPCSKCPKQFRTKALKDIHEKTHATTKDFSCDQCGFASKTKQPLTMHIMRMHAASKSFCCEICGYSTTMSTDLRRHMKNHNPQLECSECGKRFAHQINLTHHMHCHDSEPTFQCDVCHQVFKHESGVRRHKKKQHGSSGKEESSRKRRNQNFNLPVSPKK